MHLKKDNIYPLFKIRTPNYVDFYMEHKKRIDQNGHVWFCQFGKNNMKVQSLTSCEPLLLMKESGKKHGGIYIAEYDRMESFVPVCETSVPSYYKTILHPPSLWFRILSLEKFDFQLLCDCFVGNTSGGDIEKILQSMCPAFFIRCTKEIKI